MHAILSISRRMTGHSAFSLAANSTEKYPAVLELNLQMDGWMHMVSPICVYFMNTV
jgi:hypothetical protein